MGPCREPMCNFIRNDLQICLNHVLFQNILTCRHRDPDVLFLDRASSNLKQLFDLIWSVIINFAKK